MSTTEARPRHAIKVGIAEIAVADAPGTLGVLGLGSCIALMLYDAQARRGALAHVMLPQAPANRDGAPGKFADSALEEALRRLVECGSSAASLSAKIAGGARMFSFSADDGRKSIGDRNIDAVKQALAAQGVPLVGEDTGGTYGRSVVLDLVSGIVTVRSLKHGERSY